MTLKNSDLKKPTTTSFQRRRLLSLVAATREVSRDEDGKESSEEDDDVFVRKQLDSEKGHSVIPEDNSVLKLISLSLNYCINLCEAEWLD